MTWTRKWISFLSDWPLEHFEKSSFSYVRVVDCGVEGRSVPDNEDLSLQASHWQCQAAPVPGCKERCPWSWPVKNLTGLGWPGHEVSLSGVWGSALKMHTIIVTVHRCALWRAQNDDWKDSPLKISDRMTKGELKIHSASTKIWLAHTMPTSAPDSNLLTGRVYLTECDCSRVGRAGK